jgi:flagellar biosynthetic protein FliR
VSNFFSPGHIEILVLLFARVGGLVMIAPMFTARAMPVSVKTAITVLLALLLHPLALASAGGAIPAITPETFIGETLVGFGLGLGAALLVGASSVAGEMMGIQIGLSGAAVLDPVSNTQGNVLGTFTTLFSITLLFAVDAHLVMIDAIGKSLNVITLGSGLHAAGLLAMVKTGSVLFGLGLQFAAPVIAAVLVGNTALAILSRAAPQLNLFSVAFPIQIGIGLTALAAAIPFIGAFYHGWSGVYNNTLDHVFRAFTHGGAA